MHGSCVPTVSFTSNLIEYLSKTERRRRGETCVPTDYALPSELQTATTNALGSWLLAVGCWPLARDTSTLIAPIVPIAPMTLIALANSQQLIANSQRLSLYVHDLLAAYDVDARG